MFFYRNAQHLLEYAAVLCVLEVYPNASSLPCSLSIPHVLLTDASRYLVVVAPGAVCLADCGRQLFGGQSVAAVAEVGHPCADGVICGEHTSVDWRAGRAAWHGCRREKDNCKHVHLRHTGHMLAGRAAPEAHRGCSILSTDMSYYSFFVEESHLSSQLLLQVHTAAIYYYPLKRKRQPVGD